MVTPVNHYPGHLLPRSAIGHLYNKTPLFSIMNNINKEGPRWLGSKIYGATPALSDVVHRGILSWRLADAHPLGARRKAIALSRNGQLVGYLEDRYVGTILKANAGYHVHVTAWRRRRGLCWAVVRFYPRATPKPVTARTHPRLPYVDL